MFRSVFLLILTAYLTSCSLLHPSKSDEVAWVIPATDPQEMAFVQDALADIQSAKATRLPERFPNEFLARALMGPKAARYSDEQVRSEYLDPLKERFQLAFSTLVEEMRTSGIKAGSLRYVEHRLIGEGEGVPPSLVLVLASESGATHELPLAYTVFNEKWYVLEILNTYDVF